MNCLLFTLAKSRFELGGTPYNSSVPNGWAYLGGNAGFRSLRSTRFVWRGGKTGPKNFVFETRHQGILPIDSPAVFACVPAVGVLFDLIMMKLFSSLMLPLRFSLLGVVVGMMGWYALPRAQAQDRDPEPVVVYDSSLVQIQGQLPLTTSYSVTIISPSNLPGVPTPITFEVTPTTIPAGVSAATAIGYLSFSPATLVFDAPNQARAVTITMAVPATAVAGAYNYKILAVGWPVDPEVGLINLGTAINSTITAAAEPKTPPTVTIASPLDGSTVTVFAGGLPVGVPLTFTASGTGSNPSVIDSVTVELDGNPVALSSLDGLLTLNVTGAGTLLASTAGSHVVRVSAHNDGGTVTTTSTFTVMVVQPVAASVTILTPVDGSTITVPADGLPVEVPLQFEAASTGAGQTAITVLRAELDGEEIALATSGLGSFSVAGTATLPIAAAGPHTVAVWAANAAGEVSASSTFTVEVEAPSAAALGIVRHAPTLNGAVDGSLHVLLPESITLNGNAWVSGALLVPGTPSVRLNGQPAYGGAEDGTGAVSPLSHMITLNGGALLGRLIRRTDPIELPTVSAPPPPAGNRDVALNKATDNPGSFATIRNFTLNGSIGAITVPPGTYGNFTANGNSSFILGEPGSSEPAVYNFQNLTLNGTSKITLVGPVVLTLANGVAINGSIGAMESPAWLLLQIYNGGLTLNGNVSVHGSVVAPKGTIIINGNSTLKGRVICDRLTINGNGLLDLRP